MGMLGNHIAAGQALTIANDSFNGNGSTVAFTLSQTVGSVNDIEVLVDNVQQSPYDSSYSVSGTTLTFSGAPSAGTNNVYVIYNASRHIATSQVIPDDGSVHSSKIASNAVTDAKIAAVATSKLTGDIPYANMPVGSVIQVEYHRHESQETYSIASGTGGAYSNVQKVITPKFANSKILVIISLDGVTWTTDGSYGRFRVKRLVGGSPTEIGTFGYPRQWSSVDNSSGVTMSSILYDAPNTTSAITYLFDFYSNSGTSGFNINRDNNGDSSITLMEIAQ